MAQSPLPFIDWSEDPFPEIPQAPSPKDPGALVCDTSLCQDPEPRFYPISGTLRCTEGFRPHAECCWSLKSHQLLAYNQEFQELFEMPEHLLQSGFQWTDLGLFFRHHPATIEARRIIKTEHDGLLAKLEVQARFRFTHALAEHRVKRIEVFATAFCEELRWICLEVSESDAESLPQQDTTMRAQRAKPRSAAPYAGQVQCFLWKRPPSLTDYPLVSPAVKRARCIPGTK